MPVLHVTVPCLMILADANVFIDKVGKDQRNQNQRIKVNVVPLVFVEDLFFSTDHKQGQERNAQDDEQNQQFQKIVFGFAGILLVFFILVGLGEELQEPLKEGSLFTGLYLFFAFVPVADKALIKFAFDGFFFFHFETSQ